MTERHRHQTRVLNQGVPHVLVHNGLLQVVLPSDAEEHLGHLEDPDVLAEVIVDVDPHQTKVPHLIKFENQFHGFPGHRVVFPPDPLVTLDARPAGVEPEVGVPLLAVSELAHAAGETPVLHGAVVREVVQVDVGATTHALVHVVRHRTVCNENASLLAMASFSHH